MIEFTLLGGYMNNKIVDQACSFVKKQMKEIPVIAMILGSGLGELADELKNPVYILYKDIPGFPVSTVSGHASRLVYGKLKGSLVLIFQGRFHYYEGYNMEQLAFPIYFLKNLGCKTLIITNAAGGINKKFTPGDLMLISDHINKTGLTPFTGENKDSIESPDLNNLYPYNQDLGSLLKETAMEEGISLKEGTYGWMTGPSFETPAEIKMLRIVGADAVGMSTVPEVVTAALCGLKVVALSCISNMAAGILD